MTEGVKKEINLVEMIMTIKILILVPLYVVFPWLLLEALVHFLMWFVVEISFPVMLNDLICCRLNLSTND